MGISYQSWINFLLLLLFIIVVVSYQFSSWIFRRLTWPGIYSVLHERDMARGLYKNRAFFRTSMSVWCNPMCLCTYGSGLEGAYESLDKDTLQPQQWAWKQQQMSNTQQLSKKRIKFHLSDIRHRQTQQGKHEFATWTRHHNNNSISSFIWLNSHLNSVRITMRPIFVNVRIEKRRTNPDNELSKDEWLTSFPSLSSSSSQFASFHDPQPTRICKQCWTKKENWEFQEL